MNPRPTWFGTTWLSRIHFLPSGTATVSASRLCISTHFDAAVAHLGDEVEVVALGVVDPEHVVEQELHRSCDGVRRWCARPGAQTMTLRSWPTSEWTPNFASFAVAMMDSVALFVAVSRLP